MEVDVEVLDVNDDEARALLLTHIPHPREQVGDDKITQSG
jgi:hypothetical protein